MTVFPVRSMKPYLPLTLIGYRPPLSALYGPGGRFIHQYPAAVTTTTAAPIASRVRDIGRALAFLAMTGAGAGVGSASPGTALSGTSPRTALQRPQNLASAAFSNPHLHRIHRRLSALNYQTAVTMIFVIHALNSRMIGTAGAAPASEIFAI